MEVYNQQIISNVLKVHHKNIVQDIQGDVIVALYEKEVLTEHEYQSIKSEENREKEAYRLLELLPLKGSYGINQFISYLLTEYSWIGDALKISMTNEYNSVFAKKIRQALTSGEVPQLSSRHVSRTEHVKKLKDLLKSLEIGNFIVVNGMTGCGKSSLVAEVLNDPLITMQYFQGIVQWINVGRENSSEIGCVQTEVLNRLKNQEQLLSPPLNAQYEITRKTLSSLWKQKKLTEGLLVLDDVSNSQIVKYLDIGCKVVITTNDESVMDDIVDSRVKYFKVNEGFEEKETLNLFSKCLSVDPTSLPSHASKLHNICKGFPLTISLIGAQLETHKEETINSTDRWTFYLDQLSDKRKRNNIEPFKHTRRSHNQLMSLEKTIEMCIKNLPDDLQKYYKDFALFVYDLNIKPEVLSVLWNLKKTQVEDIMFELIRKSLLVRVWNKPLNSYVYSIHDLLLNNLKNMIIDSGGYQELMALHRNLIERYRVSCNGNFAELPKNDNYIFLYFGYHLKNADMLEEFPRWFLNLKFLESKICVTGPADLLADLRKYRKYIAIKSIYEKYITEIEHFVERIGPNLYQTKSDIVQLGLQEPEASFIYTESYKIAKLGQKSYFHYDIRASSNCLPEPHISIVRDTIESVIFGNRHDEVIIATFSGSIKVWNVISHKCLYTYNGHTARVTHLVKNKLKNLFLSTSDDCTIRIWNMISSSETDGHETRTPSPETRQEHWQNLFHQDYKKSTDITDCVVTLNGHTGPVIFAQFSSDDKLIVSSSNDKTLKIWKMDSGSLHMSISQTSIIYRCCFMETTTCDRILFSTLSKTGTSVIYGCQWPFEYCTGLLYLNEKVLSFFPIPNPEGDDRILIMTPKKVDYYQLDWGKSLRLMEYPQPIGYQHFKLSSISEEHAGVINNSRYIAFGLSNCTIKICDLITGYNFLDLNDPVQGILSLDWFWSKVDHNNWLLCASENKSIRLWCLNDITQYTCSHRTNILQEECNSHLENICKNEIISLQNYKLFSEKQNLYCYKFKQNFDAVLHDKNSIFIAAITKCGTLKILLKSIDKWSIIDKRVSALSIVYSDSTIDNTILIVACEDSSLHMLNYQTTKYLFDTRDRVDRIFGCFSHGYLVLALLLKTHEKINETYFQHVEIWAKDRSFVVKIQRFIDCYVFHDKVVILYNSYDVKVIDVNAGTKSKLEVSCIKINGSLMLNSSELAITNNGNTLKIFKLTSDFTLKLIDQYELPFKENELTSISISNNKNCIVVGGQKDIVIIDKISKTIKHFTSDTNMNNIQLMVWSSDDKHIAIKEDNHIIVFDVESGTKIASVRITADKYSVDSTLETFVAINTAGHLVMLSLLNNTS